MRTLLFALVVALWVVLEVVFVARAVRTPKGQRAGHVVAMVGGLVVLAALAFMLVLSLGGR